MIKQNNQNVKKGMFPYFLLLVIALSIMFFYSMTSGTNKELSYNEFNQALLNNNIMHNADFKISPIILK